jgi:hypothetical protein
MISSLVRNIGLLLILPMLYLTTSCKEEVYTPSESEITIAFFDAIYNQKDLDTALSLSSASFKKEVKKYRTLNNFSRRGLNLSFDSVSINTQKSATTVIDAANIHVTMTVLLTGKRNERIYKEVKKIQLIKKENTWLVNKLLKI